MVSGWTDTLRFQGSFVVGSLFQIRIGAIPIAVACMLPWSTPSFAEADITLDELNKLSIEELGNIKITSVSKRTEPLSEAPAAVYVVTQNDIEAGAISSLPEALRLAPTLDVAQTSPSAYNIASRGLSGNVAAQNFPNKLLVLVDGRSVYSPLYSGVYWDMQNVFMDDVDRIEVISGPGATLWGANAFNGVINVTSKNSADTQGGLIDISAGNLGGRGGLRYGGRINDDLTYRVYGLGLARKSYSNPDGTTADDGWSAGQGGFRFDWKQAGDLVTVQGDAYLLDEDRLANPDQRGRGRNVLTRWQHVYDDGSSLQVQGYYDYVLRGAQGDSGSFSVSTYDLELQHSFRILGRNRIVWGIGERVSPYSIHAQIGPATSLLFEPASRMLQLTNGFVEDQIMVTKAIDLTLGVKAEDDPYSHVSTMPGIRLAWRPRDSTLLWAAVSRAIRAPTPFDTDVIERLGTTDFLRAVQDFQPEGLWSYETGYRGAISSRVTLSVSGYWDVYDHLRSIETAPGGGLPLHWGNSLEGKVYGVQAWSDMQLLDGWRLSAGIMTMNEKLHFTPGSSGLLGMAQAGNDPRFSASLRSLINLGRAVSLETDLRYVGRRPNPHVASFAEGDAVVTWKARPELDLYLSGENLFRPKHVEYAPGDAIPRSVTAGLRWRFP